MSLLLSAFIFENLTTVLIFLLTVGIARVCHVMSKGTQLPPGPWCWPVLGYLPLLLSKDKREIFRKLRAKYGDLVYLRAGSQPILLVSGDKAINEVMVKRSKEFEGRPQVFTTLKPGQGKGVVNSSGPLWREHRLFLVNKMKGLGIGKTSFDDNVFQEIDPFLEVIKSKQGHPFDSRFTIQTAMSNIICFISFGKRFDYNDKHFIGVLKLIESNMKLVGGTSIVNYFPWLERVPGDVFKCRESLKTVDKVQTMTRAWVDDHKLTFDPENPRDLIDLYLLDMEKKQESNQSTLMDESQLIKFIGDLLVAGAETTATTLQWILLFLVRNPSIQQRVHQEISSVLGTRKHLLLQDKDSMPYTSATILESQRLADIAPFSLAHSNPLPAQLNGYTVPTGTVVIPVLNSVHHCPQLWENPMDFKPERFLDDSGEKILRQKEILPYCAGSRACPGRNLAIMELFFFLTSIVQHFHVLPGDKDDLPPLEGHIGVTYVPKEHQLRFVPRSTDLNGNLNHVL